jgi:hypothetical protein
VREEYGGLFFSLPACIPGIIIAGMPAFRITTFVPPQTRAPAPFSLLTTRFRTFVIARIVVKPSPIEYASVTRSISSASLPIFMRFLLYINSSYE